MITAQRDDVRAFARGEEAPQARDAWKLRITQQARYAANVTNRAAARGVPGRMPSRCAAIAS
jgi:hypothetical protein